MNLAHGRDERSFELLERAFREALIARGVFTQADLDARVEVMHARTPALGARVVARAWNDAAFKARLLADGSAAVRELGIEVGALKLVVVENTPEVHNLVVCTLCSCYPLALLGPSPAWYKSEAYRSRAVRDPRGVLAEFGTQLADDIEITVWDSTAEVRYLVLPARPAETDGASEAQLATLVTRNGLIGTALV